MSNALGNNGGRQYSFRNRPVLIDCSFVVDSTNANGLGISSLTGAGVQNVFMHTSQTPGRGANSVLNPNPATGYALIQLANNYKKVVGNFTGKSAPLSGSNVAINGSALTAGQPYVITSVGHGTAGAATIAPVADTAGSLASTYFSLFDSYGQVFIIWFSVSGVGRAPTNVSGILVQQSIATGDTAATIGAALVTTIQNLPSAPSSAVMSFTAAGTTTVTVTSTANTPLAGVPADGAIATGFTMALTKYKTNNQNWRNVGLPAGLTPTVNQAFIATATGDSTGGGSTGLVKVPGTTNILSVELIGDPNTTLAPGPRGGTPNVGGWIMVQFVLPVITSALTMDSYTPAGTNNSATPPIFTGTPAVLTGTVVNTDTMTRSAPTASTIVSLSFLVEAGT